MARNARNKKAMENNRQQPVTNRTANQERKLASGGSKVTSNRGSTKGSTTGG